MATVGTIEVVAKIDTSGYKRGAQEIENTNNGIEGSTTKSTSGMNKALVGVGKVGFAALATAAVGATALIVKNIDGAISRIDSLVAFPRVLKALGVSGEEAQAATTKLSDSLQGLPTSLNQGTRGVQGFITSGLDVNKATDAFLGFNNAMLAAGVETGAAEGAMMQLNQALSRGRIDGAEWNSIAANIPTVMQALQNETGKSKDEIRELFREDPQGLIDSIIRLNQEGGGGIASLEEQARAATGGIGTAFANMDNAIQRAIQNIVTNIGGGDLEAGQRRISDIINSFSKSFGDNLIIIGNGVSYAIEKIQQMIAVLNPLIEYVKQNETAMAVWKMTLQVIGAILVGVVMAGIVLVVGAATLLTAAVNVLVGVFMWLMQTAVNVWGTVSSVAVSAWKSISSTWSAATGFFSAIYNSIISFFSQLPGRIRSFFSSAWNSARSAWSGAGGWFAGLVGGIVGAFTGIPGRIAGLFSSALSQVKGIWGNIAGWFASIDLSGAGQAMIQSLIDGIGSMVGKAKAKVDEVVSSIRDFFPSSPAKTGPFSGRGYTTYSGQALMDDFAKGMLNESGNITRAANTAIGGAMGAFGGLSGAPVSVVGGSKAFDNMQGGGSGITNNIQNVTIASEVDGERWLRRLSGNQEIVSNGLVPTQSYMG